MKKRPSAKHPVSSSSSMASPSPADDRIFSLVGNGWDVGSIFLRTGILFGVVLVAALFLLHPFSLLSTANDPFPRGFFFLLPFVEPGLYFDAWFGGLAALNPANQTERIFVIIWGLVLLTTLLMIGRLALVAVRLVPLSPPRYPSCEKGAFSGGEILFFSFVTGFALCSAFTALIGFTVGWRDGMGRFVRILFPMIPILAFGIFVGIRVKRTGGCRSVVRRLFQRSARVNNESQNGENLPNRGPVARKTGVAERLILAGVILFGLVYAAAGTIPPFEYDALEYHFQGAREFFEAGRIGFVDHNVYLNMPLGTEAVYLWGILTHPLTDPSESGSDLLFLTLCGAKFLVGLAPIFIAVGMFAFGRRFFGSCFVGGAAALGYLAFPDLFQMTANGLNDGVVGLFLFGALYAFFLFEAALVSEKKERREGNLSPEGSMFLGESSRSPVPLPILILCGLAVGSACACKLTAVPFLLIPVTLAVVFLLFRQRGSLTVNASQFFLFFVAVALTGGGWYAKNFSFFGNPFWPLGWRIFGDRTGIWDVAKNARWSAAHSAHDFSGTAFFSDFGRFVFSDDFSPILLAVFSILILVPLTEILSGKGQYQFKTAPSEPVNGLLTASAVFLRMTVYSVFFLLLWWTATHRLLRFLLPVAPILAILTAAALDRTIRLFRFRAARGFLCALLLAGGCYSVSLDAVTVNGFFVPYQTFMADADRYGDWAVWIDRHRELFNGTSNDLMGKGNPARKLLLVGQARAFAYRGVPVLYNTCWDDSSLTTILPERLRMERNNFKTVVRSAGGKKEISWNPSLDWTDEEILEIRRSLSREKIGWILVDNAEIGRFLSPGNYGLTDKELMTPEFFTRLEKAGITEVFRPEEFANFRDRTKQNVILYRVTE